jgi:hypothetical protein
LGPVHTHHFAFIKDDIGKLAVEHLAHAEVTHHKLTINELAFVECRFAEIAFFECAAIKLFASHCCARDIDLVKHLGDVLCFFVIYVGHLSGIP